MKKPQLRVLESSFRRKVVARHPGSALMTGRKMIQDLPAGPVAGLVVAVATLLTTMALLLRRWKANGTSKYGERLASLEATVAMLNGDAGSQIVQRLATIEAKVDTNTTELQRLRDWRHDHIAPMVQRIEGRLANVELDLVDLRRKR